MNCNIIGSLFYILVVFLLHLSILFDYLLFVFGGYFYCCFASKNADSIIIMVQLVFSVFTGEAWGYLGSRRFLFELDLQSEAVNGLNSSLIETVFLWSSLI